MTKSGRRQFLDRVDATIERRELARRQEFEALEPGDWVTFRDSQGEIRRRPITEIRVLGMVRHLVVDGPFEPVPFQRWVGSVRPDRRQAR